MNKIKFLTFITALGISSSAYAMKPITIEDQGSFMAGGIQCGEMLLNFDGQINGKSLDKSY